MERIMEDLKDFLLTIFRFLEFNFVIQNILSTFAEKI